MHWAGSCLSVSTVPYSTVSVENPNPSPAPSSEQPISYQYVNKPTDMLHVMFTLGNVAQAHHPKGKKDDSFTKTHSVIEQLR